jgi:hypothetical protein
MKTIPEEIEVYRDQKWRREELLKIETAAQVESLVQDLGFCLTLTDSRTVAPSVYIAVCGRRDVHTPPNVQKDVETSMAWVLKDEVFMRGKVFYGKICKGRSMFIAPRLVPYFKAIYGVSDESELSIDAQKVLAVLRVEWEIATSDLHLKNYKKRCSSFLLKYCTNPNLPIFGLSPKQDFRKKLLPLLTAKPRYLRLLKLFYY